MKKLYREMNLRELRREMRFLKLIQRDINKRMSVTKETIELELYLCEQANNIEFQARLRTIDYIYDIKEKIS